MLDYYFVQVNNPPSAVSLHHWSATNAVNLTEEHAGKALGLSGPTPSIINPTTDQNGSRPRPVLSTNLH